MGVQKEINGARVRAFFWFRVSFVNSGSGLARIWTVWREAGLMVARAENL
jgi:hypothetical protein